MSWSFNPFTGNLDLVGSGGSVVFEGEVPTFADLPVTIGDPAIGAAYLVRDSTGVWLVNRRQAGIYIRRNDAGLATDWEYGGDYPVNSVNGQTGNVSLTAGDVGAVSGLETRTHSFYSTSTYTLAQGRNVQLNASTPASYITATILLPRLTTDSAQNGDDLFISATGFGNAQTLIIQRYIYTGSGYLGSTETVVTTTTGGAWRFRLLDGVWTLQPVTNHTHAAADVTSGTFDNARVNFAAPPAIGNTTPSTGAFTTLSAAPTSGSALTLTGGTVTASAPLISATQTWNNSGVGFRAINVAVTNTASATESYLYSAEVGGSIVFYVRRDGRVVGAASVYGSGTLESALLPTGVAVGSAAYLGLCSNTFANDVGCDTRLFRDAAGVLAQRNAANAQRFNLYGTFTSSTNFERLFLEYNSTATAFRIGTEKGSGGGTGRSLQFVIDGVNMLELQAGGSILANRSILTTGGYGITSDLHFTLQTAGGQLRWGGTSSVPMLKRSSAIIQARLGDDSAYTTIDAQHRLQGTAPATAGATGTAGDIRYDADYIYVCTATNTWKRAAIATW
jgi:hypothetical protein